MPRLPETEFMGAGRGEGDFLKKQWLTITP